MAPNEPPLWPRSLSAAVRAEACRKVRPCRQATVAGGRVPVAEPTWTWSGKQGVDLPCVRPILRFYNEACAHRIFQHIPPLPFVAFGGAQQMIEKLPLPKRRVQSHGAKNALCRPLFKSSNEPRQTDGLGGSALATEEMQMIRHHDITTYCPTIAFGRSFKFLAQDGEGVPIRENPPPTLCAARDEIDRESIQSSRGDVGVPDAAKKTSRGRLQQG